METLLGLLVLANIIAEDKTPLEIAYIAALYGQLSETLDTLAILKEYEEEREKDLTLH